MPSKRPRDESYDVLLRTSHPSVSYKILCYFRDPDLRPLVAPSPAYGGACRELDPPAAVNVRGRRAAPGARQQEGTTVRSSSCLVALEGVTVPWGEYRAFLEGSVLAPHVQRAMAMPRSGPPCDGVRGVRERVEALVASGELPRGAVLRLAAVPGSLAAPVVDALHDDSDVVSGGALSVSPSGYSHVLQVALVSPTSAPRQEIRVSVVPAADFFKQPPDAPPVLRGKVCKAGTKVHEALRIAACLKSQGAGAGAGAGAGGRLFGVAVDVGAAPGAWTQQLAAHAEEVVAIDPAEMDPRVSGLPNVRVLRATAQRARGDLEALLAGRRFECLVSDMNRHPSEMAEILAPLVPHAAAGAFVALTLKFRGTAREKRPGLVEEVLAGMGGFGELERPKVVWLLGNTVAERTLLGWVPGPAGGGRAAGAGPGPGPG